MIHFITRIYKNTVTLARATALITDIQRKMLMKTGSKFYRETDIELPARQIIRHGVLDIVDIGHPVIAAHVGYVEKVEDIQPEHDALEMTEEVFGRFLVERRSDKLPTDTDVETFVGRCTEI